MFRNKTQVERGQIIGLYKAHKTPKEIANILQFDIRTVKLWIKNYNEQGELGLRDHRLNNSAPYKLTMQEEQNLVRYSSENPFQSTKSLKINLNLPIVRKTVSSYLNKFCEYYCYNYF